MDNRDMEPTPIATRIWLKLLLLLIVWPMLIVSTAIATTVTLLAMLLFWPFVPFLRPSSVVSALHFARRRDVRRRTSRNDLQEYQ